MQNEEKKLSRRQQNALHLYFKFVAEELNNAGLDVRRTLKPDIDIPWSPYLVKELLWREVQKIYLGKRSTKDLTTSDINDIHDIFNRHLGERFGQMGVEPPAFPSLETLMEQELKEKL